MSNVMSLNASHHLLMGPKSPSERPRVMIVEDEAPIALDLERRLERLGFEVVGVADNRDEAVELCSETSPNLVLMDISIRGDVDGIDTARDIGRIVDTPVIFLTAYADDVTVARAAEISPYGYLQKPYDDRTLVAMIKVVLARHSSDRMLRVLAHVVSSATIGIVVVEVSGSERPTVFVNDAFLRTSGYTADHVLGQPLCFFADDTSSEAAIRLMDAVSNLTAASDTLQGRRANGELFWSSISVSPVRGPGDRVSHVVILLMDITREREAQNVVAELQRVETVGQISAAITHDFNNILTVVQTFATLARDAVTEPSVQRDLDEVLLGVKSGTVLTRRLLDYTRRSPETVAGVSDLNVVIHETRRMLEAMGGNRTHIDFRVSPEPMFVGLDTASVEQVLLNLVANARDAMPEGGTVTISTELPSDPSGPLDGGTYARLEVRDTGPGIDPETAARVFEPFFTTKPQGLGTGLGLVTCRMLAERAGGSIAVRTAPGLGTSFVVDLPISESRTAGSFEELNAPISESGGGAPCLLVEPDGPLRRAYSRVLKNAGFDVSEAATGQAACRALDELGQSLRVLICNASLPMSTGADVPSYARQTSPQARLFLLAGNSEFSTESVGADVTVLWKPVSASALARRALDAVDAEPVSSEKALPAEGASVNPVVQPRKGTGPSAHRNTPARRAGTISADPVAMGVRPIVLLVEDDEQQRRGLTQVLEGHGLQVRQAASAAEAQAAMELGGVAICLVDVNLPDENGLELLTTLRKVDALLPVLVMTGDPSVERAQQALRGRAAAFLSKPLDLHALVEEVERALREGQVARLQQQLLVSKQGSDAMLGDLVETRQKFDASVEALYMVFQPIVRAHDGTLYAYEALMRSNGPYSNPGDLLAAGDVLGRVEELGRAVRLAISRAIEEHPERTEPIFVNLHPMEFSAEVLTSEDEPLLPFASRIVFEVTERAQLSSSEDLALTLQRLRAVGYRIALDDLGEGYAGLSWLVKLVPDIAKIDMSLVRNLHLSRMKRELVGSLVSVCRRARTLLVAEGVELAEEAAVLRDLGCELLQGYYYARPSPSLAELPPREPG